MAWLLIHFETVVVRHAVVRVVDPIVAAAIVVMRLLVFFFSCCALSVEHKCMLAQQRQQKRYCLMLNGGDGGNILCARVIVGKSGKRKTFTAIFYYPNLWRVFLWFNPNSLLFWCAFYCTAHSLGRQMQAKKAHTQHALRRKVFVTNRRARRLYALVRFVQY